MGNKAEAIKQRIVEKADQLFYQRGYAKTSFSDIASALNISRGNFYYHFKTKDDILDAVIDARKQSIQKLLAECENSSDPRQAIRCCIDLLTDSTKIDPQIGCPAGTLCLELSKLQHAMHDNANGVFLILRQWLTRQFEALGIGNADQLAMHLLTRTQGLSTMMSTFNDADYQRVEIQSLYQWLDEL